MCGRYSVTLPPEAIRHLFGYANRPNLRPRYNIAPTQAAPIVRLKADGERELAEIRWGLVVPWSKGPGDGPLLINARVETVATSPAFRAAFKARRCLVPADGFYEWQRPATGKGPKQVFRIHPADGGAMAFAGIWERWTSREGEILDSFAILTTGAQGPVREIYGRMPVMLDPADYGPWLDVKAGGNVLDRLKRLDVESLVADPVSSHVNAVRNDDPRCFDPPNPAQQRLL